MSSHTLISRTRRAGACAALALLLGSTVASAQSATQSTPTLTPDERARELYLRGDRLYAEGSYGEAVTAFQRAYELSRRPVLLYDMANALERLGRYEEALQQLNAYAPHAPEHQRHTVLKRINSLEARAEEQHRKEGPARANPEVPSGAGPAAGPIVAATAESAQPLPWLGYAIGGAGLLSIGLGVAFGVSAASARSDAEARCVDNGASVLCPRSVEGLLSDRRSRALAADIAWGLGAVGLGVGLYLILDADSESGSATQLRTSATSSGGTMDLVTTF
jgi:tetratricopeptide (TPR) repeat protein